MDNYFFAFDILAIAYAAEWHRTALRQRRLRDINNPFDVPVFQFIDLYRMDQITALDLIQKLEPHLRRKCAHGIPVALQVLCALRFFASGSYQRGTGRDHGAAMSQSSVSRCITAVSLAVCHVLLRQTVRFPITLAERRKARQSFTNVFGDAGFPRTMGAIDCTHVCIKTPVENEEQYYSHLGRHTINVQVISDARMKIISIVPRYGGARHDTFIWQYSQQRRVMEKWWERGERQNYLIGDSGYPLEPWLMTPILHAESDSPEGQYTHAHVSTRNVVERCFGLLKTRWRCLSDQRVLNYDPDAAIRIISCCAVLHNICLARNLTAEEENEIENHHVMRVPGVDNLVEVRVPTARLREARRVRAQLVQHYFV